MLFRLYKYLLKYKKKNIFPGKSKKNNNNSKQTKLCRYYIVVTFESYLKKKKKKEKKKKLRKPKNLKKYLFRKCYSCVIATMLLNAKQTNLKRKQATQNK